MGEGCQCQSQHRLNLACYRRRWGRGDQQPSTSTPGPGPLAQASRRDQWKVEGLSHTPRQGGAFMPRSSFWQNWLVQVAR